ncbi:LOW QUALITY PROTEIN: hypothetical protein Syun_031399 [Stephania yunnanensis]|uniref:Cytochrome P450 n=1 Tax=Stephania yunnanensis TaxID=152371 RepID=A0AAP0HEE1_9MAGN
MEVLPWMPWLAPLILLLVFKGFYYRPLRRKLNLPPGPRPWPIIGNLDLMGSLPHRSIQHLSMKYGPLMQLKFGSQPLVVASSAEMAKQVLKTHDSCLAGRPRTAAGVLTTYNCSGMVWSPYTPYWRQFERCGHELFSRKRLESFDYIRVEETQALVNGLFALSGKDLKVKEHLAVNNMNVISRIAFGKKYLDGECDDSGVVSAEEFRSMLDEIFLLNGVLNIGDWIPWLGFMDLHWYVKRMRVVSEKFDRLLEHVIDEHKERKLLMSSSDSWAPKDMVDLLLEIAEDPSLEVKFTRSNIKAQALELIGGGTESSTVTIEWAISELMKKPMILKKAQEELDKVIGKERWVEEKDMPNLPYIQAITKETMRMHPLHYLFRALLASMLKSLDYDIPVGTRVIVNVWAIGRDPVSWNEPNEFRPERFVDKVVDVKGHHFELLPFGAGRRMCPGYLLGLKVIQSTLANLIHGFEWKLAGGMSEEGLDMEEIFGLSTPRKIPLNVIVEPRLPTHLYVNFVIIFHGIEYAVGAQEQIGPVDN